ncbi:hypothetical protein [Salinispira pacifica]
MKKFLISLVILIVAAAVVFYFGWVQLQLPADSYAVAFTKTGGWDSSVLKPGTFIWRWERVVPTNFKLYIYDLSTRKATLQASGTLPSGDVYTQYMPGNPSFSYRITVDVSYRLNPDALPQLTRDGLLSPDGLDNYYSSFESGLLNTLEQMIPALVNQKAGSGSFTPASLEPELISKLSSQYPNFTFFHVTPTQFELPDFSLYDRARTTYTQLVDAKTRALEQASQAAAQEQVTKSNRLDLLRQYGEVLTQYPILLKYLALESGQNPDSINLNDLKLPASPSSGGQASGARQ